MKTTPKQYAISLYEASKGASKAEMDELVSNFVKLLRYDNNLSLGDKIIEEFQSYYRAQKGIAKLRITSSAKLDSKTVSGIVKHFSQQVELEEAVDESLIGGIVLEIDDDTRIDGSVKKKLETLKQNII
jgi:F-type H+-transporting ATPase subunit delta